jgi:hypothetical protein
MASPDADRAEKPSKKFRYKHRSAATCTRISYRDFSMVSCLSGSVPAEAGRHVRRLLQARFWTCPARYIRPLALRGAGRLPSSSSMNSPIPAGSDVSRDDESEFHHRSPLEQRVRRPFPPGEDPPAQTLAAFVPRIALGDPKRAGRRSSLSIPKSSRAARLRPIHNRPPSLRAKALQFDQSGRHRQSRVGQSLSFQRSPSCRSRTLP